MELDDFWKDVEYAAEEGGMTKEEFAKYLEKRAYERAIELLGEFAEVEYE